MLNTFLDLHYLNSIKIYRKIMTHNEVYTNVDGCDPELDGLVSIG